jgi:hypothetical protein
MQQETGASLGTEMKTGDKNEEETEKEIGH